MLGLACLQYAGTLRNAVLEGVYYGAFEAKDAESNTAPIFDLTPFVQLMDWSRAVSEFTKFGSCQTLYREIRAGTGREKDRKRNLLRTLAGDLEKTGRVIAGCRGKAIFLDPPWERIPGHLEKLRRGSDPLLTAFAPLMDLIAEKIALLRMGQIAGSDEVRRGLGAVRWCLEHDMVQQAYSILYESMVTYLCQVSGMDFKNDKERQLVAQCPKALELPKDEWRGPVAAQEAHVQEVRDRVRPEILRLFGDFSGWCRDIMHCKLRSDKDFEVLKKKVTDSFNKFLEFLKISTELTDGTWLETADFPPEFVEVHTDE